MAETSGTGMRTQTGVAGGAAARRPCAQPRLLQRVRHVGRGGDGSRRGEVGRARRGNGWICLAVTAATADPVGFYSDLMDEDVLGTRRCSFLGARTSRHCGWSQAAASYPKTRSWCASSKWRHALAKTDGRCKSNQTDRNRMVHAGVRGRRVQNFAKRGGISVELGVRWRSAFVLRANAVVRISVATLAAEPSRTASSPRAAGEGARSGDRVGTSSVVAAFHEALTACSDGGGAVAM